MIGFIGTWFTVFLNYNQYNTIADLHKLQFTVAHALGFSVFTSRLLGTDLNTETSTSNHYEASCHFLFNHTGTSELNYKLSLAASGLVLHSRDTDKTENTVLL
jgi:hypothetical protein